ncbi:MAG: lytic transglycosylase [Deltaproteobacteria bacterium HGW-Deltaproteobacteria-2]|jgi:soluble lytic murein transglycosylase-like protein|nr:MAG: lytic transglycosylase [Deltaproteobacteria bacterium HGW-Deltaproteobacteria-2]
MKALYNKYLINFSTGLFLQVVTTVLTVFIITTANVAHADIYKYVDNEGVLHLTNVPTDHNVKYVMIMREKRILFQANLDVSKYDELINKAANKFKLDSALIKAIIKAESNFNHRAVSRVGAQGLMQLMPKTASSMNVEDSFHPEKNIEGGARYLRYLLNTYKGNLDLALAAYNAGEKAVAKYNYNIPPYRETQNYVKRVYSFYKSYNGE